MLEQAVRDALAAQPAEARDQAVAELALTYAATIDGGASMGTLGPALLACLEALHMSPRARTGKKASGEQPAANPLDELAGARSRRGRTPGVDATGT